MATKFPDLFDALASPFGEREVRQRKAERDNERKVFDYITATSVKNRLDTVMGPECWWTSYIPVEGGVECRLTLRMPDGAEITKSGVGSGKDVKAAYSDALKRAAEEFGVGRYLRKLGRPPYIEPGDAAEPPEEPRPDRPTSRPAPAHNGHASAPSQGRPAPTGDHTSPVHNRPASGGNDQAPTTGRALFAWVKRMEEEHQVGMLKYLNSWAKLQDFPARMVDFTAEQVHLAYGEGCRKLASVGEAG